ncbi:isoleucine--trna ligase, partial [Quercus suber]
MKRTREDYTAGGEVSLGYGAPSWCRGQLLGRGGFGSVFVAKLKKPCFGFPPTIAVKSEHAASGSSSLLNEERFIRALKGCPNVVQSFGSDITTTNSGDIIYNVFLELASGSLADFIKQSGSGTGMPEFLEAPSDIWALGCSVLMMFTGQPPWATTPKSELMSRIAADSPTIPPHISKAAQNFLSCCFVSHPAKRLTATELLSHIFLLESDEGEEVYIQEKAKVSDEKSQGVKPQSHCCPSALPSFIPLPSSSSEEEEEDITAAAKRTCYRQIHPLAIMGCQPPVTFTVMPYCTGCKTPELSKFEDGSGHCSVVVELSFWFNDVPAPEIMVTFPIISDPHKAAFMDWKTTPWILPSNLAICIKANK